MVRRNEILRVDFVTEESKLRSEAEIRQMIEDLKRMITDQPSDAEGELYGAYGMLKWVLREDTYMSEPIANIRSYFRSIDRAQRQ